MSLEKKIDNNKLMAIQEHLLCCNYSPSFEDFSTLTRESKFISLLTKKTNKSQLLAQWNDTAKIQFCRWSSNHLIHLAITSVF